MWPHIDAVISSHVSAWHTRQWRGFKLVEGATGVLGVAGGIVNKSSFFNDFASSTGSWGEVIKLWEEDVERGEIAWTGGGSSVLTSSTVTTVTGERLPTGDTGRGLWASGISYLDSSKSIGVVIRGEIDGSSPRSAGEATSGEWGLTHSLNTNIRSIVPNVWGEKNAPARSDRIRYTMKWWHIGGWSCSWSSLRLDNVTLQWATKI